MFAYNALHLLPWRVSKLQDAQTTFGAREKPFETPRSYRRAEKAELMQLNIWQRYRRWDGQLRTNGEVLDGRPHRNQLEYDDRFSCEPQQTEGAKLDGVGDEP